MAENERHNTATGGKFRSREAIELVEKVTSYLNTSLDDAVIALFVDEMAYQHRTLQQNFTRMCVAWLEHLGTKAEGQYDLRNGASVMLGREFIEKIPPEKRHLPTV